MWGEESKQRLSRVGRRVAGVHQMERKRQAGN